jgi:SpoVK/Ycf46/Vps4 family AAA+-type ATPase
MLKDTPLAPGFPLQTLAERSEGLSGSDLKELCRNAAMLPVREYVRRSGEDKQVMEKAQLEVCAFDSGSCLPLPRAYHCLFVSMCRRDSPCGPSHLETFFNRKGQAHRRCMMVHCPLDEQTYMERTMRRSTPSAMTYMRNPPCNRISFVNELKRLLVVH